jgi:UDP:flavonoid glycosyltransferase YjiC (YdhE family)
VSNFFTAEYLDGNAAAKRADMVICNGGSLTCQQAFAHGKPVLGIAANMDQFLNMEGVSRVNAGLVLRLGKLDRNQLGRATVFSLPDVAVSDDGTAVGKPKSHYHIETSKCRA